MQPVVQHQGVSGASQLQHPGLHAGMEDPTLWFLDLISLGYIVGCHFIFTLVIRLNPPPTNIIYLGYIIGYNDHDT